MKKSLLKMFLKDNIKLFLTIILSIGLIVWVIQSVGFLDFVTEDGHVSKGRYAWGPSGWLLGLGVELVKKVRYSSEEGCEVAKGIWDSG